MHGADDAALSARAGAGSTEASLKTIQTGEHEAGRGVKVGWVNGRIIIMLYTAFEQLQSAQMSPSRASRQVRAKPDQAGEKVVVMKGEVRGQCCTLRTSSCGEH